MFGCIICAKLFAAWGDGPALRHRSSGWGHGSCLPSWTSLSATVIDTAISFLEMVSNCGVLASSQLTLVDSLHQPSTDFSLRCHVILSWIGIVFLSQCLRKAKGLSLLIGHLKDPFTYLLITWLDCVD